jgi:hypothetical protein
MQLGSKQFRYEIRDDDREAADMKNPPLKGGFL